MFEKKNNIVNFKGGDWEVDFDFCLEMLMARPLLWEQWGALPSPFSLGDLIHGF